MFVRYITSCLARKKKEQTKQTKREEQARINHNKIKITNRV